MKVKEIDSEMVSCSWQQKIFLSQANSYCEQSFHTKILDKRKILSKILWDMWVLMKIILNSWDYEGETNDLFLKNSLKELKTEHL